MADAATGSMVARVALILRAFDEDHDSLTVSELASRTGLPVGTAHRIAGDMVAERLLDRNGTRYSIGTGLWEQGELAAVSLRFREIALPFLLSLYEASGENVHLAILDEGEALYAMRLVGHRSVPTISRMGGRLPLHTTGVGKALLAFQDEEFLRDFFSRPLERPTVHSRVDEGSLRAELEAVRRHGFSVTNQEMTLGNASIAVPIFVADGPPYAAVGLVSHLTRADTRRVVPMLKDAASGISEALGVSLDGGRRRWRDVFHTAIQR
ncbi:IclR family transcriptional regulator [Salinibacterium sp. SYSU T00001]|uniref:IclR family transcriptional regulator n=1 Tax=Homoserinimonas sedimenticola TaxID=2986805 RepID=UPI002235D57B|nr:IclR family transcriptional regulator [Salinibacterium sedimenticola]MCW4386671.1 IclR family transcriptional regulator [Salinibacterium sedimenticola]